MKEKLSTWTVLVLFLISTNNYAQITNLSISYGGSQPTCNPFEDDPNNFQHPWKVSHGTPGPGDIYNDGFYDGALLEASFDWDSSEKTEGLFINYEFKSTNSYTLVFELAHNSYDQLGISIYASTGVENDAGEDCNLDSTPSSVSSKDEIYSNSTVDGNSSTGHLQVITASNFNPDANYSQLWIHSKQEYLDFTGSFILTNVLIEDHGPVDDDDGDGDDDGDDDQDKPTTPGNPRITQINENFLRLAWNQSINYDGGNVSGYSIYKGTDYHSTYTVWGNLYFDIPFDCSSGSHSFSIKAFNSENIYSPRTELVYIDAAESITLDTDESAKKDLTLIASNEINFKPGFHFKASSYGDELWGKIISCESSSSSRELTTDNYEENYDSLQSETKISSTVRTLERKLPEDQLLSISPNPSNGMFNLTIAFENEKKTVNISVYDMYGSIVVEKNYENVRAFRTDFDLSEEEKGLYVIQVLTENSKITKKVILQ